jgi:hypothetical protein
MAVVARQPFSHFLFPVVEAIEVLCALILSINRRALRV